MKKRVFTNFLELKSLIQGQFVSVKTNSGVLIRTSYTNLKSSLDFDQYNYEITFSEHNGNVLLIHDAATMLK